MKVLEVFPVKKGIWNIVCDIYKDSEITEKIQTDIGAFDSSSFWCENVMNCFTEAKTRGILLQTNKKEVHKIKNVLFV